MIRRAEKKDLSSIVEIDQGAFASYGTVEDPSVFASRLAVFSEGLLVVEQEGNILAMEARKNGPQSARLL